MPLFAAKRVYDRRRVLDEAARASSRNKRRRAIALYRWVLGSMRPLDREACARAPEPDLVLACRRTGLALYADRLNHARDSGTFPCDGGPLPPELAHTPDSEIEAMVRWRTKDDLCP